MPGTPNAPKAFPNISEDSLRPMLRDCIADHDPTKLSGFRTEADYPMSGLFVSERAGEVRRCMEPKGWLDMPTWAGP